MVGRVVGLAVLSVSVTVSANEMSHGDDRDVAAKLKVKETLAVEEYSPTQVLCMKQQRTGSRVVRNRCQTLAAWRQEINDRAMRQHLIRPGGKAASWEIP